MEDEKPPKNGKQQLTKSKLSSSSISEEREDDVARISITSPSSRENSIEGSKVTTRMSKIFLVSRSSPQSSSSQEDYEPETKCLPGNLLLGINGAHQSMNARSMESLRNSRNFLSADERYEDSRSLESLTHVTTSSNTHQQKTSHHHYRSFISCSSTSSSSSITGVGKRRAVASAVESRSSENLMRREESLNAEVRRGLYASTALERKTPRLHLSLPHDDVEGAGGPPGVFSLTSPGGSDRRIHILSPHSPLPAGEFFHQYTVQSLKSRRAKAHVLPRLVLPRSESEVFLQ